MIADEIADRGPLGGAADRPGVEDTDTELSWMIGGVQERDRDDVA